MSVPATEPQPSEALPKVARDHRAADRGPSNTLSVVQAAVTGATVGYVGIVLAWAITELLGVADSRSLGPIALYTALLGSIYGMVASAWADVVARIWDRAVLRALVGALVGAAAGAVAGAVSQVLFDALQQTEDPGALRFYVLRALAWAIFGMGIGIVGGAAERSTRKLINGLIGGLVGGAIGGALFQWLSLHVDSASQARLVSLAIVGMAIGASIGVVEVALRQAWMRVVAGGMSGKEFILYHSVTNIGTSPKCEITLIKDQAAEPFHVRIDDQAGRRILTPFEGATVRVNGSAVRSRALRSGDRIEVGATTLEFFERDAD